MNYEKKYKEAIERMKSWARGEHPECFSEAQKAAEFVFPELKNKDEEIREWLIDWAKAVNWSEQFTITKEQVLAWLEKQCEKKLCMIQWKGDNLKEVINFTGKDKNFDKWFTSFEEYEKYVREHNDIFKLFNEDGSHYEVPVGAWIIKTPDGCNVASKSILKQKLADKTEPKFKVGDWIIHQGTNNIYQVVAVIDNQYQLKYGDNYTIQNCADVDRCARLWDITKDAKKGDVLRHNGCTFIFICIEKGVVKGLEENLYNGTKACNLGEPNKNNDYSPATKEQRDTLMEAMTDAGYVWNVEKKELRKIKLKIADKVEPIFSIGDVLCDKSCTTLNKKYQPIIEILDIRDGMYICNNCTFPISQQDEYELVTKKNEPQYAWSDEDKEMVRYIGNAITCKESAKYLEEKGVDMIKAHIWLESLKPQPKQEWSEKDDYNLQCMIAKVTFDIQQGYIGRNNELIDWLKSLKQRYTWKPSEEQIHAFIQVYVWYNNNFAPSETLTSLYNDLKKL